MRCYLMHAANISSDIVLRTIKMLFPDKGILLHYVSHNSCIIHMQINL